MLLHVSFHLSLTIICGAKCRDLKGRTHQSFMFCSRKYTAWCCIKECNMSSTCASKNPQKKAPDLPLSYIFSSLSVFRQPSERDELMMQNCDKNIENNPVNHQTRACWKAFSGCCFQGGVLAGALLSTAFLPAAEAGVMSLWDCSVTGKCCPPFPSPPLASEIITNGFSLYIGCW